MDIDYVKPADDVFYSVSIEYKSEILSSVRQKYKTFRFKIEDYLQNIDPTELNVRVRITLFDTQFSMPFQ
jgi:hypothetical protein